MIVNPAAPIINMSGQRMYVVSVYALNVPIKIISQGAVPVFALTLSDKALVGRVLSVLVGLSLQEKEKTTQRMKRVSLKDCILFSIIISVYALCVYTERTSIDK
jgi:hypothetical protein